MAHRDLVGCVELWEFFNKSIGGFFLPKQNFNTLHHCSRLHGEAANDKIMHFYGIFVNLLKILFDKKGPAWRLVTCVSIINVPM